MKRFLGFLCAALVGVSCVIPCYAADPLSSEELSIFEKNTSDGLKKVDYTLKSQYYRFQLWENQWNNPVGGTGASYFNQATVTVPSIAGRIRPFGQKVTSLNIGTAVADESKGESPVYINDGFYLPLGSDQVFQYQFLVGMNIEMLSPDYIPMTDNQDIYGNLYLYFVNSQNKLVYKTSNVFRYQWSWHPETDTLELYCLITVDLDRSALPHDTVGLIPLYTFRTIQIGAEGNNSGETGKEPQPVYIFFPYFKFTYISSYYDNVWNDLVGNSQVGGSLLEIGLGGIKTLLSLVSEFIDMYSGLFGTSAFLSGILNSIFSIPFFNYLVFCSLVCGSVGSFLGFGLVVVRSRFFKEAKSHARSEQRNAKSSGRG